MNELKPSDLSLGYIICKKYEEDIWHWAPFGIDDYRGMEKWPDNYRPMALDAGWLSRMGLKFRSPRAGGQDEWAGYGIWCLGEVSFMGSADGKELFFGRNKEWKFVYVHQIQKLMSALGVKLDIEGFR